MGAVSQTLYQYIYQVLHSTNATTVWTGTLSSRLDKLIICDLELLVASSLSVLNSLCN